MYEVPASNSLVTVTIVTYNSGRFIERCLESVFAQTYQPLEVVAVDNASTDSSVQLLARHGTRIRLLRNARNAGFAAAQNQAIAAGNGAWNLTLNPDVRLEPDFVERLVAAGALDSRVGVVCGKLLRATPELYAPAVPRIDSTGIYFTPALRHFDRGSDELDEGQYERMEYVFGATAAAALYRREMIEEAALESGLFDPHFFAYREDADVAWRSQLLGWRCLYVPRAVGYHRRRVLGGDRRSTPSVLRMHSVKNRFLMRINNVTADLYRRVWISATFRDLLVAAGCILSEPASLRAFWLLAGDFRQALRNRRHIMERRAVSDEYIASWFSRRPRAVVLDPSPARR
jgi:GT2 family glycosyltransferase